MSNIERINIKEFRELGLLREVNREWFHPRGLALEVLLDEDGAETLGGIWDYREDPEGMLYDTISLNSEKAISGQEYSAKLFESKMKTRLYKYGFVIQPIGGKENAE